MINHTRRAPKSSTQRSREFRARNPHYYRDYHRRRQAEIADRLAAAAEAKALPLLAPLITAETEAATPLALPAPATESEAVIQLALFTTPAAEPITVRHAA